MIRVSGVCLPRVSAEERGSSARVPRSQPAHADFTRAEHKVGFLAVKAGLHEPPPALPATCMGSAFRQVPGSGLGRPSAGPVPSEVVSAGRHQHLGSPAVGAATMLDMILLSFP